MPTEPTTPDAIREQFAKLQRELDALRGMVLPMPRREPVAAPLGAQTVGQVRGREIWLGDRWCRLTKTEIKLLAYAMGDGRGATPEEVCRYMPWGVNVATARTRVSDLNASVQRKMARAPRYPVVSLKDGLHWNWSDELGEEQEAV